MKRQDATMRTIVLASRKGGAGKTTLTGRLAVEATRTESGPVAVIDTDPQGSLTAWWNERQAETPVFIDPAEFGGLMAALDQCRLNGIKLVIIDTPPQATELIASVIAFADFVVIPTQPPRSPSGRQHRPACRTIEQADRVRGERRRAAGQDYRGCGRRLIPAWGGGTCRHPSTHGLPHKHDRWPDGGRA